VLTAGITAAVAAILRIFGVKATLAQLGVVALVVKALIVLTGLFLGRKLLKRRQAAAEEEKAPQPKNP
jgi:threonine/homoserine/homoserine lactone efflux protein